MPSSNATNATTTIELLYRAAVCLNNQGVSLLERGRYARAASAFRESVEAMESVCAFRDYYYCCCCRCCPVRSTKNDDDGGRRSSVLFDSAARLDLLLQEKLRKVLQSLRKRAPTTATIQSTTISGDNNNEPGNRCSTTVLLGPSFSDDIDSVVVRKHPYFFSVGADDTAYAATTTSCDRRICPIRIETYDDADYFCCCCGDGNDGGARDRQIHKSNRDASIALHNAGVARVLLANTTQAEENGDNSPSAVGAAVLRHQARRLLECSLELLEEDFSSSRVEEAGCTCESDEGNSNNDGGSGEEYYWLCDESRNNNPRQLLLLRWMVLRTLMYLAVAEAPGDGDAAGVVEQQQTRDERYSYYAQRAALVRTALEELERCEGYRPAVDVAAAA